MTGRAGLLAAAILILSGCTGLAPGPNSDGIPAAAFGPGPDFDTLRTAHEERLRRAGSFTYETRIVIATDREDALVQRSTDRRIVRVDLGTGRVHRHRVTTTNKIIETYRTGDGRSYERRVLSTGLTDYPPPVGNLSTDRYLRPGLFERLANVSLDHRTNGSVHVYHASGIGAIDAAAATVSTENLTRVSVWAVVAESGLLRSYNYTVGFRQDGATYTVSNRGAFHALGETSVVEPSWLDEARAARERRQSRPDPTDYVRTNTTREALGVTFAVYTRADTRTGHELRERSHWYTDFLNRSRAGPVVQAYWPEHTRNGTLTFRYDEHAVPQGNESALRIVRYDRERQVFVPLETTIDASANIGTAQVEQEGIYSLFHSRSYVSSLGGSWRGERTLFPDAGPSGGECSRAPRSMGST